MAQLGERRGIKHGMKSAALAWRGMLEGTINPAKGESMTDQETPERAHVTADDIEAANDLIDFIEACPSMFHTAATIMAELDEAGLPARERGVGHRAGRALLHAAQYLERCCL